MKQITTFSIAILCATSMLGSGNKTLPIAHNAFKMESVVSARKNVKNPIIWADVPDPSIIRVGDTYYLTSTTMYFNPGLPIMKSKDLYSWEIVGYAYDTLADVDETNLKNGKNIYGNGTWASSLRYHNGTYYILVFSNDQKKTFIFHTKDIEKCQWQRNIIEGIYHDPSLFFDGDKTYIISGSGTIHIKQLNKDLTGFEHGGVDQILFPSGIEGLAEGTQAYKHGDYYYYLLITWPRGGMRSEVCYRSKNLLGPFEQKVVLNDDMGYYRNGVAQGGIVDTPDGNWYAFLFQDHGGVGRIPILVPMKWEDNWPVMGINGKVPQEIEIDHVGSGKHTVLAQSDDFNYSSNKLNLLWQWNHNPDNSSWSVTERKGYLRLKNNQIATSILDARNTLTQRTEGPECTSEVKIDLRNMKPGDRAGITALQFDYGEWGVELDENGEKRIYLRFNNNGTPIEQCSIPYKENDIYLKLHFLFGKIDENDKITPIDKVDFSYSKDGKQWIKIDDELKMTYKLQHFTGYRFALFSYPTKIKGGYADFDYLRYSCVNY